MENSISFIIPTLNEYTNISETIRSIYKYASLFDDLQIIVVDNESTDNTVSLAQEAGAEVYVRVGYRIGQLRNMGLRRSRNKYLVFLDADVNLTEQWGYRISHVLSVLGKSEFAISGSTCCGNESRSIMQKCWLAGINNKNEYKYINSGHLVIRKDVFFKMGGFSRTLITGEDSDSRREKEKIGNHLS